MRIYPAIRAHIGDWKYYIVRMKMREIAHEVELASDIYEDRTLSDAIQRAVDDSRVKNSLVNFLARRDDRFFSSLVVAAIGGSPSWYEVQMDPGTVPPMIASSKQLRESFGILSFDEDPRYYALDGQHRLSAIKLLVNNEADVPAPDGFDDEHVSVLVVLREEQDEDENAWLQRYRRLFSSLNRYAKPTDADTNIIMDEDDVFAIVTRRLITEHPFFQAPGHERESFRVQTKGKTLKAGSPQFISLQTLYSMNQTLLESRQRKLSGWGPDGMPSLKAFIQYRPEEEVIDNFYEEVRSYWDAIIEVMPELRRSPVEMRCHKLPEPNPQGLVDHLVFWPIGQEVFASVVRDLLDEAGAGTDDPAVLRKALSRLPRMNWDLHAVPWRNLLLVGPFEDDEQWRMRSEGRKEAIKLTNRLVRWIFHLDPLDRDDLEELRGDWETTIYPHPEESTIAKMWQDMKRLRDAVADV